MPIDTLKLVDDLADFVYNKKRKHNFGTLIPNGWFSAAPDDASVNRAIRTNNAGALNISNWQKRREGYAGQTEPDSNGNVTTIYQTPEHGIAAWYYLINSIYGYSDTGHFTIRSIARKYAGGTAPDHAVQAYIDGWRRWSNGRLEANTVVRLSSQEEILQFAKALFAHEADSDTPIHDDQILSAFEKEKNRSQRFMPLGNNRLSADFVLEKLTAARKTNDLEDLYENFLADEILSIGQATIADPTENAVVNWLRIYSIVADLALEGPGSITLNIYTNNRQVYDRALHRLGPDEFFVAEEFIASLNADKLSFEQLEAASLEAETSFESSEYTFLAKQQPLLAVFRVSQLNNENRVVRYTGELIVYDHNENEVGRYNATTGGFIASYKKRNGPTPPGYYVVSHHRRRTEGWATRDGIGYTFDIDEVVQTGNRSAFRIHPDGPPAGTHGCVGIVEDEAGLRDCEQKIKANLAALSEFRLLVKYARA